MSTTVLHPLAAAYLDRLSSDARSLPRGARQELLADIESHLAEATTPAMSDAEVLTVLDRLGEPDEIVAAQEPNAVVTTWPSRRGAQEWAAIFLLLFGGFILGIGWIAGVVLLWSSATWTTRDKWIGTLVLPGGLAISLIAIAIGLGATGGECTGGSPTVLTVSPPGSVSPGAGHLLRGTMTCTGGSSTPVEILIIAALALVLIAPVATAIYLARRAAPDSSAKISSG
jgi:hypothetical protein